MYNTSQSHLLSIWVSATITSMLLNFTGPRASVIVRCDAQVTVISRGAGVLLDVSLALDCLSTVDNLGRDKVERY